MTTTDPATVDTAPDTETSPKGPRRKTRLTASIVLLVLAVLLAPLTVVANWARWQIVDTDRYLATVAPLASEPAVQEYVAATLATGIHERLQVDDLITGALPDALQPIAPTLDAAVQGFLNTAATRFTQSPAFETLWVGANRAAHRVISGILTADIDVTDLEDGQLTLDVGEMLRRFQTYLVDQGLTIVGGIDLSGVERTVVLAEGEQLEKLESARQLVGLLRTLVFVLLVLTVVCAAGSVLVAPNRRKALVRLGVGLSFAMLLVALGLGAARRAFLDALTGTLPGDVAGSFFDTVAESMRIGFRSIFVLGLVIAALVAITALPAFPRTLARPTQIAVAALGVIALLLPQDLRVPYVVVVVLLTLGTLAILELERRRRLTTA